MFNFAVKGYNNGIKNSKCNIIFLDYILFIANIIIILVLLTSIFIKCYNLDDNNDENILYIEVSQAIIYLLTIVFLGLYCFKSKKQKINISRVLFLVNILFNIFLLFCFDFISKLEFKIYYNQIINNLINFLVIVFVAGVCGIFHIKKRYSTKI